MKEINYTVSFSKPYTHYCEVEIHLKDLNEEEMIFSLPVWTPGSYLIREYSKNAEGVRAEAVNGAQAECEKINKNTWRVKSDGLTEMTLKYRVYCNELTVRTSEINSEHAFLSSAGIFMKVNGYENLKCKLNIRLPDEWKKISTGLRKESGTLYSAENYDEFIDSPVEIGNQNIMEFETDGIKHYISVTGRGNYDEKKLVNDFSSIVKEEVRLSGDVIPYNDFTFIIHLIEKGGGGLEHLNSFVAQMPGWSFCDEKKYRKFLGLISHEFFHLWNVKRVRPEALGPFDYDKENYTKELWVAEGWTNFYDDLILRRCGLVTNEEYFELLDIAVNDIMKTEGRFHQSLEESSFDTWIKFYRKDENFSNTQISYYTKGGLVAMMLNLEIIKNTNAGRSLDDAFRMLYEDYKKDKSRGYSSDRVKEVCEKANGGNLDSFWKKYVRGTDELPLNEYLNYAGLIIVNENEENSFSLDADIKNENGKLVIKKVYSGSTAYESGLNFNDEIIAVNGVRTDEELLKTLLKNCKEGDIIKVLYGRKGIVKEKEVKILKPLPLFKTKETENMNGNQRKILNKWLEDK